MLGSGYLAQHRATGAVEEGADDLVLRVVVLRARPHRRVRAHVHLAEAPHALLEIALRRVHQPVEIERGEALAVVDPVEHGRKLAVVHAVLGEGDVRRLGVRILPDVPPGAQGGDFGGVGSGVGLGWSSLPGPVAHVLERVATAERVQHRPVRQVLDRVIRPIIATPPAKAAQAQPRWVAGWGGPGAGGRAYLGYISIWPSCSSK